MTISVFKSSNGRPVLRKCWILFLDILGISNQMLEAAQRNIEQELLERFATSFKKASNSLSGNPVPWAMQESVSFSDNIVVAWPIGEDDGSYSQEEVLARAANYQIELLKDGFFVRGGLDVGAIHILDGFVFGSGLLSAYTLESQSAIYPRIVIGSSAMEQFSELSLMYAAPEISLGGQILLRDNNGTVFLDYLAAGLLRYPPDPIPVGHIGIHPDFPSYRDEILKPHQESIITQLSYNKDNSRILSKYIWLAKYHNYACEILLPKEKEIRIKINKFVIKKEANKSLQLTPAFGRCS